jgi:hypothetical protein
MLNPQKNKTILNIQQKQKKKKKRKTYAMYLFLLLEFYQDS